MNYSEYKQNRKLGDFENKVTKEISESKELVLECLKDDERCRNDDLWLILSIWQKKQHIKIFVDYNELSKMTYSQINPTKVGGF